jgi:hypothetical protein
MGLIGPWVISMGPQIQGPSPRTQGKPRTRPMGWVLGGYPWAVETHSAVYRLPISYNTNSVSAKYYSPEFAEMRGLSRVGVITEITTSRSSQERDPP